MAGRPFSSLPMLLTQVFDAGCIGAQTITQLVVLRFIAGLCESAQLTNSGGIIADMFSAAERGKAQSVFACAPFMGPVRMYSSIYSHIA